MGNQKKKGGGGILEGVVGQDVSQQASLYLKRKYLDKDSILNILKNKKKFHFLNYVYNISQDECP